MSTAPDTPDERLAEYGRLFERALLRRERLPDRVTFAFRAEGGTREAVEDLARREAACCPFLDHHVETAGNEVIWSIANLVTGVERATADVTLDAFYTLPDHPGSDYGGLLDRLELRGSEPELPLT